MSGSERDRLLQEILAGDDLAEFRQTSLDQGLTLVRRLRHRRRAVRLCAVVGLPLLLVLGMLFRLSLQVAKPAGPSSTAAASVGPASPVENPAVKFITDEELFALFPNRPVALLGKPGQQQLVFLDNRARGAQR